MLAVLFGMLVAEKFLCFLLGLTTRFLCVLLCKFWFEIFWSWYVHFPRIGFIRWSHGLKMKCRFTNFQNIVTIRVGVGIEFNHLIGLYWRSSKPLAIYLKKFQTCLIHSTALVHRQFLPYILFASFLSKDSLNLICHEQKPL